MKKIIKEIKIPYGSGFSYDGGTLVAGDTKAYWLSVTLPSAAENEYSAMAVNQETGNYSDDSSVSVDGTTVSVRLANSMYNTEGSAKIRLIITDGEKTVTIKEVNFSVEAENNTDTIASDEPNILNSLADIKKRLNMLGLKVINSADSALSSGVYLIEDGEVKNVLLVSDNEDEATTNNYIYQICIDVSSNTLKQRNAAVISGNAEWSEWEAVGETDLSEYIKNTDYATSSNFGVVKIGTGIKSVDGVIQTDIANETLIMGRNSSASVNEVITPSNLNFAVKSALSDDRRISDMTDEEKANARGVIGALGASVLNDYYTKSQVDTKTSGTCKYKGKTNILPNAASVGDVWVKTVGDYGKFCGVNVVSVYAYGMSFDGEGGDMILSSASGFAVGKTYYVSTKSKNILGTITPTSISGNTLSFTHQTNSDYYGVFCDIAETKDSDYWNTWMGGNPVGIGETYYFYNADFDTAPPNSDTLNVTICEPNTPFVKTKTGWDALGGTVDFSDYYTRAQVDGKIASAIESALNTEV